MDQISPPFRIALLALLAVCALWFTVLKPKDPAATTPASAAPGTTGLARDVSAAKRAAAASDSANDRVQAATGGTAASTTGTTKTAPGAHTPVAGKNGGTAAATQASPTGPRAAAPGKSTGTSGAKAATTDPAASLLSAIDHKRAVVLVFWNRHASNDRAVRRAAAAANRRDGRVVVKVAAIADVGDYATITKDVEVMQSPTVLVLAPGNKARTITGFTTTAEIDQAVSNALRASK